MDASGSESKRKVENCESLTKRSKNVQADVYKQEKQKLRFLAMDAYSRHKLLVNEYLLSYAGATAKLRRNTAGDKTDYDVLKEHHKFIWDEDSEASTWEQRLAKKYYDKLYKEYCITDLTFYKENNIAMRWRTENEVLEGKGQFTCGQKKCFAKENLRTWEVNFAYAEDGEKKNALVKLRLCEPCSEKLNYRHNRKEVKPRLPRRRKERDPQETCNAMVHESEEGEEVRVKAEPPEETADQSPSNVWSKSAAEEAEVEKSVDEEFDDYLAQLFL